MNSPSVRKMPVLGDNPSVDALRDLPRRLGFIETPDMAQERRRLTAWLHANQELVAKALGSERVIPELSQLQAEWKSYGAAAYTIAEAYPNDSRAWQRVSVGHHIASALISYEAGCEDTFWEKMRDIIYLARDYELLDAFPEIINAFP